MAKTLRITNKQTAPSKGTTTKAKATPMPTAATLPTAVVVAPAGPVTVALRGGQAVANIKLSGKAYRVGAPHNQEWWKKLEAALAGKDSVAVGPLLLSDNNQQGVPRNFVAYTLRRGYLVAV